MWMEEEDKDQLKELQVKDRVKRGKGNKEGGGGKN